MQGNCTLHILVTFGQEITNPFCLCFPYRVGGVLLLPPGKNTGGSRDLYLLTAEHEQLLRLTVSKIWFPGIFKAKCRNQKRVYLHLSLIINIKQSTTSCTEYHFKRENSNHFPPSISFSSKVSSSSNLFKKYIQSFKIYIYPDHHCPLYLRIPRLEPLYQMKRNKISILKLTCYQQHIESLIFECIYV